MNIDFFNHLAPHKNCCNATNHAHPVELVGRRIPWDTMLAAQRVAGPAKSTKLDIARAVVLRTSVNPVLFRIAEIVNLVPDDPDAILSAVGVLRRILDQTTEHFEIALCNARATGVDQASLARDFFGVDRDEFDTTRCRLAGDPTQDDAHTKRLRALGVDLDENYWGMSKEGQRAVLTAANKRGSTLSGKPFHVPPELLGQAPTYLAELTAALRKELGFDIATLTTTDGVGEPLTATRAQAECALVSLVNPAARTDCQRLPKFSLRSRPIERAQSSVV